LLCTENHLEIYSKSHFRIGPDVHPRDRAQQQATDVRSGGANHDAKRPPMNADVDANPTSNSGAPAPGPAPGTNQAPGTNRAPDKASGALSQARPTLRDVARVAGLSVTQTSRALNGHNDVAEGSRLRAIEAAAALGYEPNLEARRLKMPGSRTQTIGVLLTSSTQRFSDPFLGDLLSAMVDEVGRHRFELHLFSPTAGEDPLVTLDRSVRHKRADGYVLLRVATTDRRVDYLLDRKLPFVTLGRPAVEGHYRRVVGSDDSLTAAISHLVDLGHRRIGAIALPPGYAISDRRLDLFRAALAERDLPLEESTVAVADSFQEAGGRAAMEHLLRLPKPPSAVIGFNDQLTIGGLAALADRAVAVPERMSIIGFDDISLARFLSPPLTSLRQPGDLLGQMLIQQLIAAIDNPGSDAEVCVRPELVVRASTAPPATGT